MAGLAALMTRKKRDRRRELELKQQADDKIPEGLTSKEAAALAAKKAANETFKKLILGQEIQKQQRLAKASDKIIKAQYITSQQQGASQIQSQDAVSQLSNENEDGTFGSSGNAYSAIYLGLVLICIGVVITFVGLGEKGFKTIELKMIGPVLCVIGLACITLKIIHCSFPQMFKVPAFLKKAKLRDSDQSNLMEKGVQNGHFGKKANSPKALSPRVKLQSTKKNPRPTSTIPNYIGNEDSSDDDDFDPGRSRPHSNRYNHAFEQSPRHSSSSSPANIRRANAPSTATPVTVFNPSSQAPPHVQSHHQQHRQPQTQQTHPPHNFQQPGGRRESPPNNELLLTPHGLVL